MKNLKTFLIIILNLAFLNTIYSQADSTIAKKRVKMLSLGADLKVDSATYFLSIQLMENTTLKSKPDTGVIITKWPNGNMQFRGHLASGGVFLGFREQWFENGNKKSEEICKRSEKFYNDCKCYYKNLWLESGEQIIKDGNGYYIGYHPNGQLQIKGEYKDGKKYGEWIWYYPNGNIQYISFYKNGVEDGIWKFYTEDGKLNYETENKNGEYIRTTDYLNKNNRKNRNNKNNR